MSHSSLGTPAQLRDPNYTPPMGQAIPLGIQHVLAMFASNVTPAIIIAGAAGFGFGSNSPDFGNMIYMIQMAMLFAGVATLLQTIGMGPIGARLPIVQGTSFAFLPIMIPAVAGAGVAGMAGLMTGALIGGLFHMCLGLVIGKIRYALPPLVTGLIVLMIGLALVKVGIQYAAGGVPAMVALNKAIAAKADISTMEFGSLWNWSIALVVIVVTLGIKFMTKGFMSVAAILIGLLVGYIYAYIGGDAHFGRAIGNIGNASWVALPSPFKFGFEWNWAIIIGMCLMAIVSAIETVGDTSGITKGGAGREATDKEVVGATYADGLGTGFAALFGGLPNTSFSQNVGLISMTGIMSRGVVTIGAIFLIICGLVPKIGAIISTIPIEVLGGGVIVMFGMVASSGVKMLSEVHWGRRNMLIFATALSLGLGLQLVPNALAHAGSTWKILLTSGLLPAAVIAIVLNLLLPEDEEGPQEKAVLGGLGHDDFLRDEDEQEPHGFIQTANHSQHTSDDVSAKTSVETEPKASAPSASSKPKASKASQSTAVNVGFVDDLRLIDGIGPVLSGRMTKLGMDSLAKVASSSLEEVSAIAAQVGYADSSDDIARNWQEQAHDLLNGKPPRHKAGKELAKKLASGKKA